MEEKDFQIFKEMGSFLFCRVDRYHYQAGAIALSPAFRQVFPVLSRLIDQARVLDVTLGDHAYRLLSWTERDSPQINMSWLCEGQPGPAPALPFIPEHVLLTDHLGGIAESFRWFPDAFSANQNYMFIPKYCRLGLEEEGGGLALYHLWCTQSNCQPLPTQHLIEFTHEAGGILSFYDPDTREVLIYANDHCDRRLIQVPGQPEYTFYTIAGVRTFTDYVESLAQQWLDWVV